VTYLILALVVSLIANVLLLWYLRWALAKLLYTSDNLGDLYIVLRIFENFTISLYEMEMFYGEPVMEELIDKIKLVREEIERFESIYDLTTDIEAVEETIEEGVGDEPTSKKTQEEN